MRILGLTLCLVPMSPTPGVKETGKRRSENVTYSDVKPTRNGGHYPVNTLDVQVGRFATCRPNGNAKAVRGNFSAVLEVAQGQRSLLVDAFKTTYICCTPDWWHVTRLEHHRRGRPVLLGAVVDQQVQTYLTKLLEVPFLWRLRVASRKPRGAGSCMSSEEAGQSRS